MKAPRSATASSKAGSALTASPERRYGVKRVHGLLRLAIEGGGLNVCSDRPTVILDRGAGPGGLALADAGLFGFLRHGSQVGPLA